MAAISALLAMTGAAHGDDDDRYGIYGSISGLWVMPQDGDVTVDGAGSGELEFDDGFGVSLALGYDLPALPISLEVEYSYRDAESETLSISGLPVPVDFEADLGLHTFMVNGVLNFNIGGTPLGVYGAAGIGYTLSTVDVASIAGLPVDQDEEDFTFAYQLKAGMTFELTDDVLLYGGVRWFDALEADYDDVEVEEASVDLEIGLKFYF